MGSVPKIKHYSYAFFAWMVVFYNQSILAMPVEDIVSIELEVIAKSDKSEIDDDDAEQISKDWKQSCDVLGERLLVQKGPFGMGIFDQFSCAYQEPEKRKNANWLILITDKQEEVTVKVSKILSKEKTADLQLIHEFTIPQTGGTSKIFQDGDFSDLVAVQILSNLPYAYKIPATGANRTAITGRTLTGNPWLEKLNEKSFEVAPSANLFIYELKETDQPGLMQVDMTGKSKGKIGKKKVSYKLPAAVKRNKKTVYYAHDAKGKGTFTDLAENMSTVVELVAKENNLSLGGIFKSAFESLEATFAKGYVGMRWGKQMLQGVPILEQTSMIGILAEIRGGPLAGIRFYHDRVLETREGLIEDGEVLGEMSIRWSRTLVGYSFDFDIGFIFDKIDITPKVGLWDFESNFPLYQSDGSIITREFVVDLEPSFALEIGLEWIAEDYSIRPWFSGDVALVTSQVSSASISSRRFGIDAWWFGGPDFDLFSTNYKTALLGFGIFEDISLEGSVKKDEEGTFVSGVAYRAAYIGLGLGLSW